MTVQLTLPLELERRLTAEVEAGRHASLEEAILARISLADDPELLAVTGMDAEVIRRDLNDAWDNRDDAVDGQSAFDLIAEKSRNLRAQGK
jgi:Arc/MetJ-type ribon-helix-helix transcriptional regulator